MAGIFISYRRDDAGGHAGRLYDALAARFGRDRVFMDIDTLRPGQDFVQALDQAVATADVLLALIGPRWLTVADAEGRRRLDNPDDFVRREVGTALARDDILVIPVLVGGAVMPTAALLPEPLHPLRRRNSIEISDGRWDYDVGRLINTLEPLVDPPVEPPVEPPDKPPTGAALPRRNVGVIGAAVAILLAIAVVSYFFMIRPGDPSREAAATIAALTATAETLSPAQDAAATGTVETSGETAALDPSTKQPPKNNSLQIIFRDQPAPVTFRFREEGTAFYEYGVDHGTTSPNQHTGLDVEVPYNTPIYTPAAGEVLCVGDAGRPSDGGSLWGLGCGSFRDTGDLGPDGPDLGVGNITILQDNGFKITYGHSRQALVNPGDRVTAGQLIGTSGGMFGPRSHIEVVTCEPEKTGDPENCYWLWDPEIYLKNAMDATGPAFPPGVASPQLS